jgi:ketosteroid isomerase-like protein
MQYQSTLGKDELVDLALNKYFAQVDAKNLDAVLDCFHDNAMITVQSAFTTHVGKEEIKRMFVDFMESHRTIIHRDFTCTVDQKNGRIAACFTAELEDHDGGKVLLENTNFWRIRDDKFQEVYIYMSGANPLV